MSAATDPDIRLLEAIAHPVRLAIVRELASQVVCACDLTSCCDVSQPTVSHHLKVLREAGVIDGERRGTWIYYSVRPDALDRLDRIVGTLRPTRPSTRPTGRQLPVIQTSA